MLKVTSREAQAAMPVAEPNERGTRTTASWC